MVKIRRVTLKPYNCGKNLCFMIRYIPSGERKLSLFKTPFEQSLAPENRWVKMAELVPRNDFASVLRKLICKNNRRSSVGLRVVLGTLLDKLGLLGVEICGEQSVAHRAAGVFQLYVCSTKSGESGKGTEFGAKLYVMKVGGFARLECACYENYNNTNRSKFLKEHCCGVFGRYPSFSLTDRIYFNRENWAWLKRDRMAHYRAFSLYKPTFFSSFFRFLWREIIFIGL